MAEQAQKQFTLGNNAFTRTYTAHSGCDIVAHAGQLILGNLQGISWSVTREKANLG